MDISWSEYKICNNIAKPLTINKGISLVKNAYTLSISLY